ncbi:MAG: hypothetical protein CMN60_21340 [Sphingobium sp.]|nr:hypothetical protein [Sphingobium sp.]MBS50177.1 hypothetical protein [Sphingobium sp.]|tara:strand:+ start:32793 stop:33164 length:372 start_codon:yes stop_codon:yes gene_type:complete
MDAANTEKNSAQGLVVLGAYVVALWSIGQSLLSAIVHGGDWIYIACYAAIMAIGAFIVDKRMLFDHLVVSAVGLVYMVAISFTSFDIFVEYTFLYSVMYVFWLVTGLLHFRLLVQNHIISTNE